MNKIHMTHNKTTALLKCFGSWLVIPVVLFFSAVLHAQEARLTKTEFVSLPGQGIEVRMEFDTPPSIPNSYMIDSPPRLVMDFSGVVNDLGQRNLPVNTGIVDSLNFAQAQDRLRVVTNLYGTASHDVQVEGNVLLMRLQAAAPSPARSSMQQTVASTQPQSSVADGRTRVNSIDFQRVEGNQGRVTIQMSDDRANMDVMREGGNVILNLSGAVLDPSLAKRLDVQDFATPLEFIDSMSSGSGATILLRPGSAPYDYMAYQTGNQLIVDFKPLTRQEQEEQQDSRFPFSGERIDLNFQNVEVRAVLQIIAEVADMNLVVSDNVTGTATLRLKNVPWDQALDILLKSKNLDKRETGNVLMVGTAEEIAAREMMEAASIAQVQDIAPLITEFIQIDYRSASDIKERLEEAMLVSERGFIMADDQTNLLMVRDTARQMEEVRRTIRRFDIEVAQILVEARVVETTTRDAKELGVRWGFGGRRMVTGSGNLLGTSAIGGSDSGLGNVGNFTGGPSSNSALFDLGASAQPATLSLGVVSGSALLAMEINALESEGRLNVVSQPRVVTANGQPALISSGQKIPYQVIDDGTVTVRFEEVDLRLEVTPQINPGDRISLVLKINKDAVGGQTPSGDLIIDRNLVETGVTVNDGDTVVLGGVFINQDTETMEKTPLLGDLPLLGNLFKYKVQRSEKRELLIFITPSMIRDSLAFQ